MTLRWHYQTDRGGWAKTLVGKLGLSALLDKWPQRVVAPGGVVGTLSPAAAQELGLSTKVKLVQGGADALIGMIGLGGRQARAARVDHRLLTSAVRRHGNGHSCTRCVGHLS
ncbi:hypothetical protein Q1M63_34855 [Sinorhizobium meliloti]|nr:hypothetical protein Q1M63_34855 [Sinorhizobium meliloti]